MSIARVMTSHSRRVRPLRKTELYGLALIGFPWEDVASQQR